MTWSLRAAWLQSEIDEEGCGPVVAAILFDRQGLVYDILLAEAEIVHA